jgi:hypothetical protein
MRWVRAAGPSGRADAADFEDEIREEITNPVPYMRCRMRLERLNV